MRVLLDTNVWFAALRLETGFCAVLYRECILKHQIILSEYILKELRPHLVEKARLSSSKLDELFTILRSSCVMVEPQELPGDSCRDINDVPILGTAMAGRAEVIVTGDKDLLTIRKFRDTLIMSPREFHTQFMTR